MSKGKWPPSESWTLKQWQDRGRSLFGDDIRKWKFQCPACGNIQGAADLEAVGGEPNDAYQNCIGRFTGKRGGPHQCDWASYGLFQGPDFVTADEPTKGVTPVFKFAPTS